MERRCFVVTLTSLCPLISLSGCMLNNSIGDGRGLIINERGSMLNEISATAKGIPPGEYRDVGDIVRRYFPIGASKVDVISEMEEMGISYGHNHEKNSIHIYSRDVSRFPVPVIDISMSFDSLDRLQVIKAVYLYQQ